MAELHPLWQATDADGEPDADAGSVPVRDACAPAAPEPPPSGTEQVSRRPAAAFGILLVLSVGFVFVRGVENLKGQLAQMTSIRITEEGLVPPEAVVSPGDTISWTNDQQDPHIIRSTTLCADDGTCLLTSTLLTGDTASYTIPGEATIGAHQYGSDTSPALMGIITVVSREDGSAPTAPVPEAPAKTTAAPLFPSAPPAADAPFASDPLKMNDEFFTFTDILRDSMTGTNPLDVFNNARSGLQPGTPQQTPPPAGQRLTVPDGGATEVSPLAPPLPRNPYTVGGEYALTSDAPEDGIRPPELPETLRRTQTRDSQARAAVTGRNRPGRQPATGAEDLVWVALALSTLWFWTWTERYIARHGA